jgi:hypothetical protein
MMLTVVLTRTSAHVCPRLSVPDFAIVNSHQLAQEIDRQVAEVAPAPPALEGTTLVELKRLVLQNPLVPSVR